MPRKQFLQEKVVSPVPQALHSHPSCNHGWLKNRNGTCSELMTELYIQTQTLCPSATWWPSSGKIGLIQCKGLDTCSGWNKGWTWLWHHFHLSLPQPPLSSHPDAKTLQLTDSRYTTRGFQAHVSTWEHAARFPRAIQGWEITELTP